MLERVELELLDLANEAHRQLCEAFETGVDEWEKQVSKFIRRTIWLPGRAAEHTLLAIEAESGRLFGFGAWKHQVVDLPQRDEVRVVRICYFGVAEEFKGAVDPNQLKWASRLYTAVEKHALEHPDTTPGMPFELFCDERNARGLAFWQNPRRGFEIVGHGWEHLLRLVRMPPA